ncbi:MAG: HigA family addiction module antitoxin [Gammaproteobacteria bacterium]
MSELIENQFVPNYSVSPGEILEEELVSRGMSQAELSQRTGLARKTINEIIKAKAPITPESALKLERVFRQPAEYWLNLENLFQEVRARQIEQQKLRTDAAWLKKLPLNKMTESGWVRQFDDKAAQLNEVLSFFGIASVEQWETLWGRLEIAYRKSPAFEGSYEAISAWLRQGEILAQQIDCIPFDGRKFREALSQLRGLTREHDPDVFVPELQTICAACGVAVVLVPELPKTHISGATRWLNKDKALIQLSLRHKSDDHLWFTFFHEAGHILKHGKKALFLENDEIKNEMEQEADEFASNLLIPVKAINTFVERSYFSKEAVLAFANKLGIAPGVVVGQLQHRGFLPYTHLNGLKQRFRWSHE